MSVTGTSHLYAVLWAEAASAGVPGLPGDVAFVPYQRLAALTRPAPPDPSRQLRPRLLGYAEILDRVAEATPVLPVRFGTTLDSPSDVIDRVLAPEHDAYAAALTTLAGRTQYTVRARYRDDAVIREVLAERPTTAALHRRSRRERPSSYGGGTGAADRLLLGEQVARAVGRKRSADTEVLVQTLQPHAVALAVTPARSVEGDRIADVACLVANAQAAEFEAAVTRLGTHWRSRARLRLLGPMAAYDFAADLVSGQLALPAPAPVTGAGGGGLR